MENTNIKARYRNKVGKVIIEVWNGDKWLYVKTLRDPLIEFNAECLAKVSLNKAKNDQKSGETFAYSILTEQKKDDTKNISLDDLRNAQNKLIDDILKK